MRDIVAGRPAAAQRRMETFGKYELVRRLGVGGMAEVHLAREPLAGGVAKLLVLKKIHPSLAATAEFRAMFEDEAKIAVNLNHPNIVQTFGYGHEAGTFFLVMEYVEGVDLLRLIDAARAARRKVPHGLVAYVGQQVAKGLDYAHRKHDDAGDPLHIVHRDVSPQNILVSYDGSVKLVDFGIARARGMKDDSGVIKGKVAYMSPEQASAQPVDRRSDVFSTGIVLFELLTGRTLFGGLKGRGALEAIRRADVPPLRSFEPDVPAALEEILSRALARRPEDRYQTARDLQYALGRFFFDLGSREGRLYESGTLAAFLSQVLPEGERLRATARPSVVTPADWRSREAAAAVGPTTVAPLDARPLGAPHPDRTTVDEPAPTGGGAEPAPGARERKSVVVVVGRLIGLEGLRRAVGEARAREALLDFVRVAEHVAYKHGAHADRLDERGFTLALGVPASGEEDPARAVQLALALVETLDAISRDLRPPLQLAVGVQRGLAEVSPAGAPAHAPAAASPTPTSSYHLLGNVERFAERLAAEALAGEVLVGGGIFRALRHEWRFEELDPIELADGGGSASSVDAEGDGELPAEPGPSRARVYRLRGVRPRAERTVVVPALIGREREIERLADEHRDVVATGRARSVVLIGDRGVGKRTLVRAFCERLDPRDTLVVRAAGRAMLRETPYAMIGELVRDLLGVADDADPRELKRRIETAAGLLFDPVEERERLAFVDVLSLLLGAKVAGSDDWDPGERRHRLYQALRHVADRLARGRVLVVVFEDLHLADAQSLSLIAALIGDPLPRPVLALATARPEGPSERLLADLTRSHQLVISELEARQREDLVRRRFESPDEPATLALVRAVLERAGGNPFFLHETLESLVERGVVAAGAGGRLRLVRPEAEIAVPTTVEAVVASRIDRLRDGERRVLRAAAVLGRAFRAADVAALAGVPDPAGELEQLVGRGLLDRVSAEGDEAGVAAASSSPRAERRREPRAPLYAFRNAITQEVAGAALPPEVRRELHRQAAARLAASPAYRPGADDAELAHHLAEAGDRSEAGRAYARAGAHARDVSGNATAFRHFTAALKLLPPSTLAERWDLHAEREQILRALGKRPLQLREIGTLRQLATALADGRRLAETLVRLGRLYLDAGRHAAARREIARALDAAREAGDEITEAAAHRTEAALLRDIGRYGEALERTRAALACVAHRDDRAALVERAQAEEMLGNIQLDQGRRQGARAAYGAALDLYRRLGMRRFEAATLDHLGTTAIGLGEYEDAIRSYKRSLRLGQEIGDRVGIGATVGNVGQAYALLGDLDRARRYLDKALELDEASGDRGAFTDAMLAIGRVHLRSGDIARAADALERGLELAQERRSRFEEIRALVYLAFLRLESGDPLDTSLGLARSAVKLARDSGVLDGVIVGLTAEAMTLERMGQREAARARSAEAVALVDAGHGDEEVELVLHVHARLSLATGHDAEGTSALARAHAAVMAKAGRLHDAGWRARYLGASPAREIVADAAARLGLSVEPDAARAGGGAAGATPSR